MISKGPLRQCIKCLGWYPDVFFQAERGTYTRRKKRRCKGCNQTRKDEAKNTDNNRLIIKARDTFNKHAKQFIKQGRIATREELATTYGWKIDQMAHDIGHAFGNGCPYCYELFATMPNGLWNVSLDVVHPKEAPFYRTNTRWVCRACNSEKQGTPPELWALLQACWDEWRRRQAELKANPFTGTLFESVTDPQEPMF